MAGNPEGKEAARVASGPPAVHLYSYTVVSRRLSMSGEHYKSTKREVGIFQMFPHLTTKEHSCHHYSDPVPWTNNNVQWQGWIQGGAAPPWIQPCPSGLSKCKMRRFTTCLAHIATPTQCTSPYKTLHVLQTTLFTYFLQLLLHFNVFIFLFLYFFDVNLYYNVIETTL